MSSLGWKIVGGSATGAAHIRRAQGCQDSHGWAIGEEIVCAVVADGAGSRERSATGSEEAVRGVLEWATALDRGEIPFCSAVDGAWHARDRLHSVACGSNDSIGDLATTLALVLLINESAYVCQVGDAVTVISAANETRCPVAPVGRSEYANETSFITDVDWFRHVSHAQLPMREVEGFALSTDGLRMKILQNPATWEPFLPFFDDLFRYAETRTSADEAIVEFLEAVDDQTGDDKTLVVAVRSTDTAPSNPITRIGPTRLDDSSRGASEAVGPRSGASTTVDASIESANAGDRDPGKADLEVDREGCFMPDRAQ